MSRPSPTTGAVTKDAAKPAALAVELAPARWRHATWGLVLTLLGLFLAARVGGTTPLIAGVLVLGVAAHHAWQFVRSFLRAAGGISLDGDTLVVSPRQHAEALRLALSEIRSAYVLRRRAPLAVSSPVLVLETARGTFEYPRDWFVTDGDQRRVAAAVGRAIGYL